MAGVHKYKDGVVSKNYKGLTGLIKSRGIEIVEGEGKLVGPKTVQVGGDTYTGANVILATGSYSRTLPGLDLDGTRVIASEHALQLDHVPESAIVLGGGVIGCEFASAWTSFGTKVTIVEALPHLVPLEDEANSKQLERAFRRRKIDFKLGARFESVEDTDNGVRVHLEGGDTLEAELLLVAVGRGPVSEGLGYEEQGVRVERGFVITDEFLRTSVDGVYAVGDLISINGEPHLQLAHVGFAEGIHGRRAHRRAAGRADRLRRRPAHHLQPARGRLGRAHRGRRPPRSSAPTTSRPSPTTCPATGAARSSTPRARSSWSPRRTARCSACTSSATGSAS